MAFPIAFKADKDRIAQNINEIFCCKFKSPTEGTAMYFKKLIVATAMTLASISAQATIIGLSGAAEGGSFSANTGNGPSIYTAQGFQFVAAAPAGDTDAHFHENYLGAGTVLMHDNSPSSQDFWTLSKVGSGSFNAVSFTGIGLGLLWSTNLQSSWTAAVNGLNIINQAGITNLTFKLATPGACCSIGMNAFEVNTISPVPEPETYAMLLAGLGLMGGMARRRKQKLANA
jgi:hypothetical protein